MTPDALSQYLPIACETFRNDRLRSFDVYFQSRDGAMVLYCAKGESMSRNLAEKLRDEHLIEKLYIHRREKSYYNRYLEVMLKQFMADPAIDTVTKADIAYGTVRRIAEELFSSPKADIIRRSKPVILETMNFVLEDRHAFHALIGKMSNDHDLYDHSINVGIFSMGLSAELIRTDVDINYTEAIPAFFLHDIGKCNLSPDLLSKKAQFNFLDWKLMKRHPEEGCNLLRKFGALTEEARIIVSQHHERHDGSGYPYGLRGGEIHLYAKICALADVFDGLTSHRPYRDTYTTFEALRIMRTEMSRDFDPRLFALFVSLFGK